MYFSIGLQASIIAPHSNNSDSLFCPNVERNDALDLVLNGMKCTGALANISISLDLTTRNVRPIHIYQAYLSSLTLQSIQ